MVRLTASAFCLGVCLVGGVGAQADDTLRLPQARNPAEGAVVLQVEGAVLTPSPEGAQLELKLESVPQKAGEAAAEAGSEKSKANPAPKGLTFTLQAAGGEPKTKTSVTRTMSVIATTGIEDAEAKQELEALADRLTKGAEKLEAEGQKDAAVKKRAAADMLRNLSRPTPPKMGVFQVGTPEGPAKAGSGEVEVQMITIGTPGADEGDLEARIRELKEKLAGAEKSAGVDVEGLKQKLKSEVEAMVQKMVGNQGRVFAFVETEAIGDGEGGKVLKNGSKGGQPQVLKLGKTKGGEAQLPDRVAALEKGSRMLKQTGNHEAAERLWDEAQALKAKLAPESRGARADQIAALENESRKMKEAGRHEVAEKLWDKAQALKAKGGAGKPQGPDEKLIRTLRELQDQITDLRNEVRELKERAGR